jgi:hypothetical protein
MIESNDQQWGLCDHHLVGLEFDDDAEEDYGDEWDESDERDEDSPWVHLARLAADIEAGRAEVPRGWKLDRPGPGILVWITPSGRHYASTLTGEWLPVPGPASDPGQSS